MSELMNKLDVLYQSAKDKYESMKHTEVSGYYNGIVVGIGEAAKIISKHEQPHNKQINLDRVTISPAKLAKHIKKTGEKIILD